jgi:hypothetical protein
LTAIMRGWTTAGDFGKQAGDAGQQADDAG